MLTAMEPTQRARYNADFTEEKYNALVRLVNETEIWPADFRISETPIFFTPEFTQEIAGAARELIAQVRTPEFRIHARDAIPPRLVVPNENPHPLFVQIDFAICAGENGRLTPRLIELQGFPSLYSYQLFFWRCLRQAFPDLPAGLAAVFQRLGWTAPTSNCCATSSSATPTRRTSSCSRSSRRSKRRGSISPAPRRLLGVPTVCLTKYPKARPAALSTSATAARCRIERIYNRVIFDELHAPAGSDAPFRFQDELGCHLGRASELVFPDQQAFAPLPEKRAHVAAFFAR